MTSVGWGVWDSGFARPRALHPDQQTDPERAGRGREVWPWPLYVSQTPGRIPDTQGKATNSPGNICMG